MVNDVVGVDDGRRRRQAAFVNGTSSLAQGHLLGYNDASTTVALTAHAANPRIDLVWAQARDNAEDASGSTDFRISKTDGTAAASPSAPTAPAGALVLAEILVPATSGAVTITDRRPYATALGGLHRCRSTTRPSGVALYEGMLIYETDTNSELVNTSTTTTATWRSSPSRVNRGTR